ncbi:MULTISPECIES: response regulator [Paenibacillus]|uniref:response regulator n=1 Tax=Paenibacillus TaxID=44249 RepID=UPI0022B886DB|nr:response regulator [Paenibacillus caseinilyticus]
MNLLIVEDEHRLRNSLAHGIPWEEHGIDVIAAVSGGGEALETIGRKCPDLMLLDIQMPDMDGLTLARRVREAVPRMGMVILSGHDSFAYAQTAVELGVYQYLLKPAGDREILQAVTGAAEQLRQERDERHEQAMLEYKWQQHLPQLQNRFLLYWLTGQYRREEILRRGSELGLELRPESRYAVAVIDRDEGAESGDGPLVKEASMLQYMLRRIAEEQPGGGTCWVCPDLPAAAVLLFALPAGQGEQESLLRIHTAVERMLSLAGRSFGITVSAGISGKTGEAEAVYELYEQARTALLRRKMYGGGIAIPYKEAEEPSLSVPPLEPSFEHALETALQTGDGARAKEALDALWASGIAGLTHPDEVQEQVLYLGSLLIRSIRRQGWLLKEVTGEHYPYFQNIHLLTTAEHIHSWLTGTVEKIIAYADQQGSLVSHETIKSMLEVVERELDQDLTLHMLADRLYVNASYLSRLFKQETGQPFSAYVLERKMERAKAALLEGAKVYDAALAAGYRDVSYFTKVFRKYWGTTPGSMKV